MPPLIPPSCSSESNQINVKVQPFMDFIYIYIFGIMAKTESAAFDKLNMTSEEIKTFTEALKKEEFRKLFMEYAQELQDPEKRKQYEEELSMLEQQRGVDMKFVKPDPGFVVKVQDTEGKKVRGPAASSSIQPPYSLYDWHAPSLYLHLPLAFFSPYPSLPSSLLPPIGRCLSTFVAPSWLRSLSLL